MPTRRALLTLLAAAAASACTAPDALAFGNLVDMQIVDRSQGSVLPTHRYRGASYIAGRPGDRYAVRLVNRSGSRLLVVLSIDGVNAVSGETAATGQTGYVLAPWASADITGWRKSDAEAAAFYFTALPDSYAARTDRPDNVGVIGAAIFRERIVEPVRRSYDAPPFASSRLDAERQEPERRAQAESSAGAATSDRTRRSAPTAAPTPPGERDSLAKADKLGTGHGEREYSPTSQTTFERLSWRPSEVVQVRYDSYANLVASGVIGRPRPYEVPQPFPGFVADPR
ncbi:MAG: hypothetical protein M3Z29_08980 [Pseudomonadota bacterium]|nr:hypothetical protein [Pseudomonadota bacterium]